MHTQSPWMELSFPEFPKLEKSLHVDVCVIGGGITGLTAGLMLRRAGKSVAILDKDRIATGETGYTTAHLTEILDTRYHQLIRDFGTDNAQLAASAQRAAIRQIEKLIGDYKISCDFRRLPGYLFAARDTGNDEIQKELEALLHVGVAATGLTSAPLPFRTGNAICVDGQAQFNPRKYLLPLAKAFVDLGGQIFEQTRVTAVNDGSPCEVETPSGKVTATDVIVAANTPINNWVFLHTKVAAYRSYALAAPLKQKIDGLFWDTEEPYHYIRTCDCGSDGEMIIIGGEDHKTGTEPDAGAHIHRLERYARLNFNVDTIPYFWSGQIMQPVDGLAYIGVNSMSKHVYVSTGYSGNGMTYGTIGAMLLSDLILELPNPWTKLFDATRLHVLASAGKFVTENKDFIGYFVGDRISNGDAHSTDEIGRGQGKLITIEGKKVAAYRDEEGNLHTLSAVCPHMGCHVHWNNAESTWDCPCHGSRFDATGKVANGPAVTDLKAVEVPHTAEAK